VRSLEAADGEASDEFGGDLIGGNTYLVIGRSIIIWLLDSWVGLKMYDAVATP